MSYPSSVAVVFDNQVRPDTTGVHCLRALSGLTRAFHISPGQLPEIDVRAFDLFLRVDDGLAWKWPARLRPSACWMIDTHVDFHSRLDEARSFDLVFAAQRNGAERLRNEGIANAQWLPLACDPYIHRRHDVQNCWDVSFVGNVKPGSRSDLLTLIARRFPRSFIGQAYGDELAKVNSASHIGFNCAIADDINMRVFETMACGVALTTNDLVDNGQAALFRDGLHLITYKGADDLLDKLSFYLRRDEARETIARLGQAEVHANHTYRHRMGAILQASYRDASEMVSVPAGDFRLSGAVVELVDIVIKSFLRPKALLRLVRSIRKCYPAVAITIADDGGLEIATDPDSQECVALVRDEQNIRMLGLPYGVGVAAGRNHLIEQTTRPYLLFLDDDFIFTVDTKLEHLVNRLNEDSTLGVVAGTCFDLRGDKRILRQSGGTLTIDDNELIHQTWPLADAAGLCDYFPTFALMRRAIFDQGLHWRGGIGGEHYDFCLQLQRSKWKAAIDQTVQIDHDSSIESLAGYVERRMDYEASQQWLLATWGLREIVQNGQTIVSRKPLPDNAPAKLQELISAVHFVDESYFEFDRPDVLSLVPRSAERILDIGCGAGRLGASIKSRQRAEVIGIEKNSIAAARAARFLDTVHCADIEEMTWSIPHKSCDCVIMADVLEHLRFPELALGYARQCLSVDGIAVLSIPNVRNHTVVASLLKGNWTYDTAGLLDRTHLRFYTRREIEKLLYRAGFDIVEMRAVRNDKEPDERPNEMHFGTIQLSGLSASESGELGVYQYLVAAKPAPVPRAGLTSVIVLTHNQLPYTRMCLDSIRLRTDEPYELIIVDNASTDGTVDYLRSLRGVRVIENRENRGFPAGVNQGFDVSSGDQVLLLNNDTVLTTGWLKKMLACLYAEADIGLVGPTTNNISGLQQISASYDDLMQLDGFAWDWGKEHSAERIETDRLVGFCLLIRREVIDRIGNMDEQFGIGMFEDDDYCRRAIAAGYRCVVAADAFVHHFGSRTFANVGVDSNQLLSRNKELFDKKWSARSTDGNQVPRPARGANKLPQFDLQPTDTGAIRLQVRRPKISLCMIVRDNEATLDDALASISPWVDEMIIVDTGSRDRTPEIIARHGAQLFHFPWLDSFAKARNESLRHATGEWIFWMDSDDTMPPECGRKLRDIVEHPVPPHILGFIVQVHCPHVSSDGDADVTVVDHIKLFRNRSALQFQGRIHEQVMPAIRRAGGEVIWTDIYVVHSGADQSPEARRRKQQRDLKLLDLELKEHPDNSFVLFNVGMTYADMDDHHGAAGALRQSIANADTSESHLRKAYALLIASLSQMAEFEEADRVCGRALELFPNDVELLFREGFIAHHLGQLARSVDGYRRALAAPEELNFGSVDRGLRGYKTRQNLAIVYEAREEYALAEEQWKLVLVEMPVYQPGWIGLIGNLVLQHKLTQADSMTDQMEQHIAGLRVHGLRAQIAVARGDIVGAQAQLEAGVAADSTNVELLDRLCKLLFEYGEPQDAETRLQQLIGLVPDNASAWHNLGSIQLRRQNIQGAVLTLRKAIELRPAFAASHFYLGLALEQLQEFSAALEAWRQAIQVDPEDRAAAEARARIAGFKSNA